MNLYKLENDAISMCSCPEVDEPYEAWYIIADDEYDAISRFLDGERSSYTSEFVFTDLFWYQGKWVINFKDGGLIRKYTIKILSEGLARGSYQ